MRDADDSEPCVSASGAPVERVAVRIMVDERTVSLEAQRDAQVRALGYVDGAWQLVPGGSPDQLHAVGDLRTNAGATVSAYVAMIRRFGRIVAISFESDPSQWERLRPTFEDSARHVILVPPGP